jgi:hypothetical protein
VQGQARPQIADSLHKVRALLSVSDVSELY